MNNRVMVGIASIPERAESLERVVAALAPQADRIVVSLNGYTDAPAFLNSYWNVEYVLRGEDNGGDAEKFASVDNWEGIVVTADDDILYPDDYVATLVDGLHRHGRNTIVGFHGGKTLGWNGAAMAATHKQIRCLEELAADDADVNVLGTGAMAYHAVFVPIWRGIFRHPNMADVHLACHARDFGIPMVALAHPAGWLTDICPPGRSIYESNRRRDNTPCDTRHLRRAELDRLNWAEPAQRPTVRVSVATCERPHLLADILADLERETAWADLEVAVFEDPSDADYTDQRETAERNGWSWVTFGQRLGKFNHWQLVTAELEACRDSAAEWFVFLPDDVRLVRHAIPKAIETWQRLQDPATLTLWRLKDQEGLSNWTGVLPVERDHAWEIFHVDGIYLCRRETLAFLGFKCPPLSRVRPPSSGVGRAMSIHLHLAGRRMYRVATSLAVPVPDAEAPSVMNPDVRDRLYPGVAL